MSLQYYTNYLNNISQSPNEDWREQKQAFVESMFENSTTVQSGLYEEGYPFDFNFVNQPECWASTIIDVSTGAVKNSDDYRSLYFKDISHEVGRGRYFKWNNNYWIVYETTTHELETISTCNIRRCNNWLKWITSKGEVISYPCVIEGDISSTNAQVAKTITQANSHINIIVQGNNYTRSIIKNTRIIINGSVYKFYAINNYMQQDYVDSDVPLLFMDFYLDMSIDDDNFELSLANDNRKDYRVECDIQNIMGQTGDIGIINPIVYYKNQVIEGTRIEYTSTNENIVTITSDGEYILKAQGEANIIVNVYGNELSQAYITVNVVDEIEETYNIIVSPMVESLRQGLSVKLSAKIVDSHNNEIDDLISLTPSGATEDKYTLQETSTNTWKLTNKLLSKVPLTLTFNNSTYNVSYVMNIQLKAMF